MTRNPAIPFLFILIICLSCSVKQLNINILWPATYDLPDSVRELSVLPVIMQANQFDSLRYMIPSPENIPGIKLGYLIGITDVFSESPVFDRVVFSDTTGGNSLKYGRLYWENLRKLCVRDSTRSVLILSGSRLLDYPFINKDVMYSWEGFTLLSKTKWAFFNPFSEEALAYFEFNDTIQVTGSFVAPEIDDILAEVCYRAGEKAGKSLVPYWLRVNRNYFTGPGRYLKKAGRLLKKDYWDQAALIWNVLAENSDNTVASRASYNLAVAYERVDDLDQAVLWIEHADSLSADTIISAYNLALHQRLETRKLLDEQMK